VTGSFVPFDRERSVVVNMLLTLFSIVRAMAVFSKARLILLLIETDPVSFPLPGFTRSGKSMASSRVYFSLRPLYGLWFTEKKPLLPLDSSASQAEVSRALGLSSPPPCVSNEKAEGWSSPVGPVSHRLP